MAGGMSGIAGAGLTVGVRVTVRVPATSANLGPGFDSLGIALGVHDEVRVEVTDSPLEVTVSGEGAGAVPLDESHLVVRALRTGLAEAGVDQPGLRLSCRNRIPHGRGLGSSAAAVVAGLVAARGLLSEPARLDDAAVLQLATGFEGHPDNAAAALLGSFTVAWTEVGAALPRARALRLAVHPDLRVALCVPARELATSHARAMLPAEVPHRDAAFNAARAALLVAALTGQPELLMEATEDRLHQRQRAAAMPRTAELVERIRASGGAAVVSGAGPSVLVLGCGDEAESAALRALAEDPSGWRVLSPRIDTLGACLTTEGA